MKTLFLLIPLFIFTSCSMDYGENTSRTRERRQSTYDEPYGQRDRSGQRDRYDRRSGGNRATRERVQAGTYGQTPSSRNAPAPIRKVEEKGWVDPNKSIARKYPIGNVGYREIEGVLKKQLSSSGGLTYLQPSNSVLVLDYPANHEKVKQILGVVVRDAVNVRVDVEFAAVQSMSDFGINIQHNGITIDKGGINLPNRAKVDIRGQKANKETNTRQFLTTLSGHAARLWVTQTAVDRQLFQTHRFVPFSRRGGIRNVVPVAFPVPGVREVGTSLWIRPVYTDDGLVIVELFPVLTTEINGKEQSFRVEKVETKITARPGQRVFIGGMNKQTSNFFASIFNPIGIGKAKFTDVVNIFVTPSIMKVRPRR